MAGASKQENVIAMTRRGQQYAALGEVDWCTRVAWYSKNAVVPKDGVAIERRYLKEVGAGIAVLVVVVLILYFLFSGKEEAAGGPARAHRDAARDVSPSPIPTPQNCHACELQREYNSICRADGDAEARYQYFKKDPSTAHGSEEAARAAYAEMMELGPQVKRMERVLRRTRHTCGK